MARGPRIVLGFLWVFVPTLLTEAFARLPLVGERRREELRAVGPERLYAWLQELGGAFVKFGQLLSLRYDILPPRYCRSLERLYDRVPPFPVHEARAIVEAELGAPVAELFEQFEDTPIGAASFGQIHRVVIGRGPDRGKVAVVKVQRPGAERNFDTDARWLLAVGLMVDLSSVLGQVKVRPVFRDFIRWTRRELSFVIEAKNADRVHEHTEWNPMQRIPWIYWEMTTPRVLTMEYLEGLPLSTLVRRMEAGDTAVLDELQEMGCDLRSLARNVLQNYYLQAAVGEVFHADPHPGNLIVLPGNCIGYVDFGLVGRASPEDLREQMALMDAIASQDVERLFVAVLDLLDAPRGLLVSDHYDRFADATDAWLDASDNPGATPGEKSLVNLVVAVMNLARDIGLPLTMSMTLYFKALMAVDSSVLRLRPDQDYHAELVQTLRMVRLRMIEQRMGPGPSLDRALTTTLMALELPNLVKQQVIQYQQTSQAMFRRINQLPLAVASSLRGLAWTSIGATLLLAPIERGHGDLLPTWLVSGRSLELLLRVSETWPLGFLAALVLFWAARVVAAQAMVKVQGKE